MGINIFRHGTSRVFEPVQYMFSCLDCGCEFGATGDLCTIEKRPNGNIYCTCPECGAKVISNTNHKINTSESGEFHAKL